MKVYLAAQYAQKDEIRGLAQELKDAGIECTSSWLNEPHAPNTGLKDLTAKDHCQYAQQDLVDISKSDVFVLFTVDGTIPVVRGGRHFESGYAYGLYIAMIMMQLLNPAMLTRPMRMMTVGPRENIFHYLTAIENHPTWPEALEALKLYKQKIDAYDADIETRIADGSLKPSILRVFGRAVEPDAKKSN